MKIHFLSFFQSCAILLFVISCSQEKKQREDLLVLPSVQHHARGGASSALHPDQNFQAFNSEGLPLPVRFGAAEAIETTTDATAAAIFYTVNPELDTKPEGYTLQINKEKITIKAKDQAGLFYAFVTLNQLLEDAKAEARHLPLLHIKDAPTLAFRPIHIDVKHHLDKAAYYYALIDHLAHLKINGIILEIEDKLQYQNRPEIGADDAFSIPEWRALSDYAHARFIQISPLVQGLGHASFILKHEQYKSLRDDPASDWAFNPLDPKTYEVQFDLYRDAMEATPHGKYLHVGGDEVHTTGRGSVRPALELQLIWLNQVCEFAAENGRIPIFWDDMPLKQAGLMGPVYNKQMPKATVDSIWAANESRLNTFLDRFPKNCIYMRWNYHAAETYGNQKAMDWFTENGLQVMGATAGQTRWTLMPLRESNIDQIKTFAVQSVEKQLNGLLLTLWDDDSPHFELYKRGIAAFAEYSWAGNQRDKAAFKAAYRHRTYGADFIGEAFAFIDTLEHPAGQWVNVLLQEDVHRNSLFKRPGPASNYVMDFPDPNRSGAWSEKYAERLYLAKQNLEKIDAVNQTLESLRAQKAANDYTLEVYQQVSHLAAFSLEALVLLETFDRAQTEEEKAVALEAIQAMPETFKTLRKAFETTYAKTRILNKPEGYLLDQDHHNHPANQTVNFDWQFIAEMFFVEKVQQHFTAQAWNEGKRGFK